ncbi:acidic leucine-rich nuclear phosphoprotein 32 family member B-like [Gossypium australe]|uniref:Acidic leucine-rich nuclear phosphoprotein 32 family member B-like n=1 Tax=Gossypium australe TaxID=47621 RepID=A0A5B6VWA5_9ROSI|nr:acidic leucine-rich nuclear phosphoprotein 32 family member B-like [Gossypium australe]
MRIDVKQVQFECTNSTRMLAKLEDQISQLMRMMGDIKRQIGTSIPSNTEDNRLRQGKEHVKAIALRLGKVLSSPKIPTPEIKLPLIELIEKVPKYAKFLKEMMARHKKIKVGEQVNLSASCSVIISRQYQFNAFINFRKLGLGNLKEIEITLQLVDRSSVHLKGVLEYVLVKVRSFIIPADFVVLNFEEDREITVLLGRPFLATSRSIIDLEKNDLAMKINGETKTFKCGYQLNEENMGVLQKIINF